MKSRKRIKSLSCTKGVLMRELADIGVDEYALNMFEKGISKALRIDGLKPGAANILKQEAIASGMDAAVAKGCVTCDVEKTDVLLLGCIRNYKYLADRLVKQPFGLKDIAAELKEAVKGAHAKRFAARDRAFSLDSPLLMGILNVTPDSFSDGGKYQDADNLLGRIEEMVRCGVDICDIGGESTRPGAEAVSVDEEIMRVLPAVRLAVTSGLCVSVDTTKHEVADAALSEGAHMINDISGLTADEKIAEVTAKYRAGLCIMHIQGTPQTMQDNPVYNNLMHEIKDFLHKGCETALEAGIIKESICIDPGFGFGKSLEDNYEILARLGELSSAGYPVLAGLSRKSMIGKVLKNSAEDRTATSAALAAIAVNNGADIIRAHDIKESIEVLKLTKMLREAVN